MACCVQVRINRRWIGTGGAELTIPNLTFFRKTASRGSGRDRFVVTVWNRTPIIDDLVAQRVTGSAATCDSERNGASHRLGCVTEV
jgi:hypothetical protein